MTGHGAFCNLCGDGVRHTLPDGLIVHMRVEHDIDLAEEIETWPDGDPVIVDDSLSPADFMVGDS